MSTQLSGASYTWHHFQAAVGHWSDWVHEFFRLSGSSRMPSSNPTEPNAAILILTLPHKSNYIKNMAATGYI